MQSRFSDTLFSDTLFSDKSIFQCNCSGDASCEASKSNISPCKDEVMYATQKDTVVSCTAAQWICASDMECSTGIIF